MERLFCDINKGYLIFHISLPFHRWSIGQQQQQQHEKVIRTIMLKLKRGFSVRKGLFCTSNML